MLLASSTQAMDAGKYNNKHQDLLTINNQGTLTIEQTRQVGGPGGISTEGVVPYPTVCRYKQWAKITGENPDQLSYRVVFTYLVSAKEGADGAGCSLFVAESNGISMLQDLSYSLEKKAFRIIE